jgi:polyisoprenyl-phosphate glycosyltransferase
MPSAAPAAFRIVVVTPVYRDWDSATLLCRELDGCCSQLADADVHILLVDDGSPDGLRGWEPFEPHNIRSLSVLFLRRNLGHQRAIVTGLCHTEANVPCDAVLVMDADGEDRPADAIRLMRSVMQASPVIVFAERRKRLENRTFRIGYVVYRGLHRALVGFPVRVGNFSIVPFAALRRLVWMSEMWNHYAGAIFKSKLSFELLPTNRGSRYRGRSHMNLTGLVTHGLAGIAVFQDVAAARILILSVVGIVLVSMAMVVVVAIRLFTQAAVAGWATYAVGLLLVLLLQFAATSFSLVFTLIANRTNRPFIPARDYQCFVDRWETMWRR